MKKIGPCKILRKFVSNGYNIDLPEAVGISPIFNVAYLYPYRMDDPIGSDDQKETQWEKHVPTTQNPQMEKIIDQRIGKKTRRKNYFEYLVKRKGHPIANASWVNDFDIRKHGKLV
jgi:hypothetical protein